ncbi:hypothetical protein BaRGS_00017464 [Batillaria attramentaria]|uniref:Uncharacterized protein n=1 Tax=Batillaria attramentaria TaxID=370345 RepID=A0ABD0KVP9_9CAEN
MAEGRVNETELCDLEENALGSRTRVTLQEEPVRTSRHPQTHCERYSRSGTETAVAQDRQQGTACKCHPECMSGQTEAGDVYKERRVCSQRCICRPCCLNKLCAFKSVFARRESLN